jgi:hypothetical protein
MPELALPFRMTQQPSANRRSAFAMTDAIPKKIRIPDEAANFFVGSSPTGICAQGQW